MVLQCYFFQFINFKNVLFLSVSISDEITLPELPLPWLPEIEPVDLSVSAVFLMCRMRMGAFFIKRINEVIYFGCYFHTVRDSKGTPRSNETEHR